MATRIPSSAMRFVRAAALASSALLTLAGCTQPAIPPPQGQWKIGTVRIGPDEQRIGGLEPIRGWGAGRDNTLMHTLELVIAYMGRPIPYEELMGLGGSAFRVQIHVDAWDSGTPDPLVGSNCLTPLLSAIGIDCEVSYTPRERPEDVDRVRRDVARSIDAGIPVLASNVMPHSDWGIIVGYRLRGREWWCRTYADNARDVEQLAHGWPDAVVILSPPKALTDLRPAYLASLRRAVELYETPLAGAYALGRTALEHWSDDLIRVADRDYMHANAWMYVSLIDARAAAAGYLRKLATLMPDHKANLTAAAEIYDKERKLLTDNLAYVPFPQEYPIGVPGTDIRGHQVTTLKAASDFERQAVEILKRIR